MNIPRSDYLAIKETILEEGLFCQETILSWHILIIIAYVQKLDLGTQSSKFMVWSSCYWRRTELKSNER